MKALSSCYCDLIHTTCSFCKTKLQFETDDGDLYEAQQQSKGQWHLSWPEGDEVFYGTRTQASVRLKQIEKKNAP